MKNSIFIFFLFASLLAQSQPKPALTKVSATLISADRFAGFDKFGFSYGIRDNVFFKVKDGVVLEYKNLSLGKIKKADIRNPLKIMLFYEDFNTIVTLDNQLSETQKINFSETTPPIVVQAAGMAGQNRFWIYDSLTQQIGLYDYLKNTYTTITPPFGGSIRHYESDFNRFSWIDDKGNWFSCDTFGKITPLGKVPDFEQICLISDTAGIYAKDGKLLYFNLNGDKTTLIDLDKNSFRSLFYDDQILSIFTTEAITNYKIRTP